jgi:hypothetical protein
VRIRRCFWLAALGLLGCGGSNSDSEPIAPPPILQLTVVVTSSSSLAFVGAQDGSAAWQPVPTASGEHAVLLTGKSYGVAYGCAMDGGVAVHVLQATLDEGTRAEVSCGAPAAETLVAVTGSVLGLGAGQSAQIDVAGRVATVSGAPGSFTLEVPPGSFDAFARRFSSAPAFDSVIRRNDVALGAGSNLDFDFAADPAFAPDSRAMTIVDLGANETASVLVVLRSASHGSFSLGSFPPSAVLTLPASALRSDELHSVVIGASDATTGAQRGFRQLLRAGQDLSVDLLALPDVPTFSVDSSSPYLRPAFTLAAQTAEDVLTVTLAQMTGQRSWEVSLSKDYLSGKTTYTLPDLGGIPSFDAQWGLASGVETSWRRFAQRAATARAELLEPSRPLLEGATYRTTTLSATQSF